MAFDLTTVDWIFDTKYADQQLVNQAARNRFLLDRVRKRSDMTGKNAKYTYRLKYSNPQGIGSTVALAQAAASASKGVELEATRRKRYGVVEVDGEAYQASKGNADAMLDLWSEPTDAQIMEIGDSHSFDLYRSGNGIRGRRASEASDVVTLETKYDARNFKVDMVVGASPNSDGSSPRTGTTRITAVDEDAGTITLDVSDITSHADNDYYFRAGDVGTCIDGLAAIIPATASPGTFRGQARTADRRRLAGVFINDTSAPLEVNIGQAAVAVFTTARKYGETPIAVCNPETHFLVQQRLDAKILPNTAGGKAQVNYASICINTQCGPVMLYPDPDCPLDRAYLLCMSSWWYSTLGPFVHIIRDDGLVALRKADDDAWEARMKSTGNLICISPGANAVIAV